MLTILCYYSDNKSLPSTFSSTPVLSIMLERSSSNLLSTLLVIVLISWEEIENKEQKTGGICSQIYTTLYLPERE